MYTTTRSCFRLDPATQAVVLFLPGPCPLSLCLSITLSCRIIEKDIHQSRKSPKDCCHLPFDNNHKPSCYTVCIIRMRYVCKASLSMMLRYAYVYICTHQHSTGIYYFIWIRAQSHRLEGCATEAIRAKIESWILLARFRKCRPKKKKKNSYSHLLLPVTSGRQVNRHWTCVCKTHLFFHCYNRLTCGGSQLEIVSEWAIAIFCVQTRSHLYV
ncbi:hypothetical protein F5X96DRAFT_125759 [Biscogniauxia mediterranea]|nr:hypothetical protein F5X96DRAFT_125759 [Biscogniauxia mediterranea]